MNSVFERRLKVNKTDAFELDVSSWSNNELLVSASVTSVDSLVTVVETVITDNIISVLLTGITPGVAKIHFNYSTHTRSDCFIGRVIVIEDC